MGDDATDGDSSFGMNLLNIDDDILNMIILLCFLDDLSARPFETGVDGISMVSSFYYTVIAKYSINLSTASCCFEEFLLAMVGSLGGVIW